MCQFPLGPGPKMVLVKKSEPVYNPSPQPVIVPKSMPASSVVATGDRPVDDAVKKPVPIEITTENMSNNINLPGTFYFFNPSLFRAKETKIFMCDKFKSTVFCMWVYFPFSFLYFQNQPLVHRQLQLRPHRQQPPQQLLVLRNHQFKLNRTVLPNKF